MGKNLAPKCKQCRRIGEKLFLKGDRCSTPSCAIIKRNYPPGFHGQKGKRRSSDFGLQLAEKQKAKKQYNILEKQFKITFEKASNKTGDAGENLLKILESRLDNTVFRSGFAPSRNQARQMVNHGHFTVNGRKVNIPSFELKAGDIIKIREQSKRRGHFKGINEKLEKHNAPGWLHLNPKEAIAKVLHQPSLEDIQSNINTAIIVEYYSR